MINLGKKVAVLGLGVFICFAPTPLRALEGVEPEPESTVESNGSTAQDTSRSTRMSLEEAWKRVKETEPPDPEALDVLVRVHSPLVTSIARRMAERLPSTVSFDELFSAGLDGLYDAILRRNMKRRNHFATYATTRITGAILDWLRTLSEVPRVLGYRMVTTTDRQGNPVEKKHSFGRREMGMIIDGLTATLGRAPTVEEIMEHTGSNRRHVLAFLGLSRTVQMTDLESRDEQRRPREYADPHSPDSGAKLDKRTIVDLISRGLNRDERLILMLYYWEALTMAEIGKVLDLSESRISQIHKDLIVRLRCAGTLRILAQ